MQQAHESYIRSVKKFIQEDEISGAFEYLEKIDQQLEVGIENDIVQQRSRYKGNERDNDKGILPLDFYTRQKNLIRNALLNIVDSVPRKIELNMMMKGISVSRMNFSVPDDAQLEKVLGDRSYLVKISWLERATKAAKSVCRIVLPNGGFGTGFLAEGGYLFTNNHVLPNDKIADGARIEFNFEEDAGGNAKTRSNYTLDADTFVTSTDLDYTRIKVFENPNGAPLSDWGNVMLAPDIIPSISEPANIIQHPNGDSKQIALTNNKVLSVWGKYVFYTADTEPGSSGSPVFNQEWKVVALHHAGEVIKGDKKGLQINSAGERASANRGILFSEIVADLKKKGL